MKSRICWRIARGVLAVLMVLAAPTIGAEEYPSKPIRFAIGFPAGSGADITYRPIIDRVSQTIGQSIVIEPHPGGGGMVIARYLKGQPADGYAIALATASVVNSALRSHGDIDLRRDYTPIVPLTSLPLVIAVNSDVKANSLKELLDLVRANPGKYNYASFGVGSGSHFFMEWMLREANAKMVHVPYQGAGPASLDTALGRTHVAVSAVAALRPYVASMGGSGKLRILAVSTAERSPLLPDVPGMRELGLPQVDFPVWTGVIGPRDMPRGVVEKLRRAFNAALQDPKLVEHVKGFGHSPVVGGPNDLSKAMLREYDASTKLIQEGIKLE